MLKIIIKTYINFYKHTKKAFKVPPILTFSLPHLTGSQISVPTGRGLYST
jgi:hypothetical protein